MSEEEQSDYLEWLTDQTTVIVMVTIGAVFLLGGSCLIACLIRYPSFEDPEKLEKDKQQTFFRRNKNSNDEQDNSSKVQIFTTNNNEGQTSLSSTSNKNNNLHLTATQHSLGLDSVGENLYVRNENVEGPRKLQNWRLPTPGGASPLGRLPPMQQPFRPDDSPNLLVIESRPSSAESAILQDVNGHSPNKVRFEDSISEISTRSGRWYL